MPVALEENPEGLPIIGHAKGIDESSDVEARGE